MHSRRALILCFLAVFFPCQAPARAEQERSGPAKPRFADAGVVSTNEGHATLRWVLPGVVDATPSVATFELQRSRDSEFANPRLLHRGPGRSFFVSGLGDGKHYFRVRAVSAASSTGPWSDPLVVDVDYPGSGQVVSLLGVGCLVLAATIAAIVAGWARTHRRKPLKNGAGE